VVKSHSVKKKVAGAGREDRLSLLLSVRHFVSSVAGRNAGLRPESSATGDGTANLVSDIDVG